MWDHVNLNFVMLHLSVFGYFQIQSKRPSLLVPEALTLGMAMLLFSLLRPKFQAIIDGSRVSRNLQRTSHLPRHPLELR